MTAMPREVARKLPANLPVLPTAAAADEMRRRQDIAAGQMVRPLTAGQLWFYRIGALTLLGFGLFCMVIASMQP